MHEAALLRAALATLLVLAVGAVAAWLWTVL